METETTIETAADLRALVARARVSRYRLAARARMHPSVLGMVLNERRPLSRDLVERIVVALGEERESA